MISKVNEKSAPKRDLGYFFRQKCKERGFLREIRQFSCKIVLLLSGKIDLNIRSDNHGRSRRGLYLILRKRIFHHKQKITIYSLVNMKTIGSDNWRV